MANEAVEKLVQSNNRDELVEKAQDYELDTEGTKRELAERILAFESGVPLASVQDDDDAAPADPPADDDEPADDEPVDDEPVAAVEGKVLLRFTGKARGFEVAGQSFSRARPFKVVDEDVADRILEGLHGNQFRIARPSEAEAFYS